MLELTVIAAGGQSMRQLTLTRGTSLKIGRGRDCDIRLSAPTVSRQHAAVVAHKDGWVFRDAGSTHGSFVEGQRVKEVEVKPGLEVRIGPVLLRFENLASRIGRELDRMLEDDEARSGPVRIEIIGLDGRRETALDETIA